MPGSIERRDHGADLVTAQQHVDQLVPLAKQQFDRWAADLGIGRCRLALRLAEVEQNEDGLRQFRQAERIVDQLESAGAVRDQDTCDQVVGQSATGENHLAAGPAPSMPGSLDLRCQVLRLYRRAVNLILVQRRAFEQSTLGAELRRYCEATGERDQIGEAIELCRDATLSMDENDPAKPAELVGFADTLITGYSMRIGSTVNGDDIRTRGYDLDDARRACRQAYARVQSPAAERSSASVVPGFVVLWRWGRATWLRYLHVRDHQVEVEDCHQWPVLGDLDDAIALLGDALRQAPRHAHEIAEIACLLGQAHVVRYNTVAGCAPRDLTQLASAVGHLHLAVRHMASDHPDRETWRRMYADASRTMSGHVDDDSEFEGWAWWVRVSAMPR